MSTNYREHPTFSPKLSWSNREDGSQEVWAPFPVAVYGSDDYRAFLGVGNVIGTVLLPLTEGSATTTRRIVMEVEDVPSSKPHTLLETEAWWERLPDQVVDDVIAGTIATESVSKYLEALRMRG